MNIEMIRAAARRLEGQARRTPLLNSAFVDEIAGSMTWSALVSDVALRRCFLSPPMVGMRRRRRNMASQPLG